MSDDLIVACVRTGDKYGPEYVERLRRGVERHLNTSHRFVCITDKTFRSDIELVDSEGLPGWWAKMLLFRADWRSECDVIYLDLDTVVVGNLLPLRLVAANHKFGICANFAREYGSHLWPCKYGSCTMTLRRGMSQRIWENYIWRREHIERRNERYGDQKAIEELYPDATILQSVLPRGYFLNYRELNGECPVESAIVVFGGKSKPDNAPQWVQDQWTL